MGMSNTPASLLSVGLDRISLLTISKAAENNPPTLCQADARLNMPTGQFDPRFVFDPKTSEEWEIMRQHPEKGYRIALATKDLAGIAELILNHHERWDGVVYSMGLQGEEIPIECRILSIADSYDAMTSDRPYRKAQSSSQALSELKKTLEANSIPGL